MAGDNSTTEIEPAHRLGHHLDRLGASGCFLVAAFLFVASLFGISQFFYCTDPLHGCAYVKLGTPFGLLGAIISAALGRWLWPKRKQG